MRGKVALAFAFCGKLIGRTCTFDSHLQYHHRIQLRHFCDPSFVEKTMREAYEDAVMRLTTANIPDPESSARYLLSDVLDIGYRLVVL